MSIRRCKLSKKVQLRLLEYFVAKVIATQRRRLFRLRQLFYVRTKPVHPFQLVRILLTVDQITVREINGSDADAFHGRLYIPRLDAS